MTKVLRQTNIYFELSDKYFDSFAVNFACNFTYIFGSVVCQLISLTARLGCLCTDELSVDLSHIVKSSEGNEGDGSILRLTAPVYDPLEWISPILIDMLSPDLKECYDQWMTEL